MFGLASVSSATALSNNLYWGENGFWWFRPALTLLSIGFVIAGLVLYFRKDGICSLDDVRRQRQRVINTSLIVAISSVLAYIVLNFVILTEISIALDLPWESSRLWK